MNNGVTTAAPPIEHARAMVEESPKGSPQFTISPSASPTVIVVETAQGFDALREAWDELLMESDGRVFQTFEWQRTWWRVFGERNRRAQLHLVVVQQQGRFIGIAPLFIQRLKTTGPLSYRRMCFVGCDTSDYLDVIARKGMEEIVLQCLARHLADHRHLFDVVFLIDIPQGSKTSAVLCDELGKLGLSGDRYICNYCPRLSLPETTEAMPRVFPGRHRTKLMKRFHTLNEAHGACYERVDSVQEIDGALDELIAFHQERWSDAGFPGALSDHRTLRFHRVVGPLLCQRRWSYVAFLSVEGKRVVAHYCFDFRGVSYTYLTGFRKEEKFMNLSPGHVLFVHRMIDAIQRGNRTFDFMRGPERYKYEFGASNEVNWALLVFSRPGKFVRWEHRASLLRISLQRRMALEYMLLRLQARRHGLFSRPFAEVLAKRARTIAADALQKVKAPGTPLDVSRDQDSKEAS